MRPAAAEGRREKRRDEREIAELEPAPPPPL